MGGRRRYLYFVISLSLLKTKDQFAMGLSWTAHDQEWLRFYISVFLRTSYSLRYNTSIMRLSELFTKTRKSVPADELALNAQLLIKAGFIHKEMAGVYSYLPLGLR